MELKDRQYQEYAGFLRGNVDFTIGKKLEKVAAQKPDYPAFIYQDKQVSYQEFHIRANRFAWFFVSEGIRKGDVVALWLNNSPDYLAMVIGLSRIGAIAALISTELKGEKLAEDINLSEARLLIVEDGFKEKLEEAKDFLRLRYPGKILFYSEVLNLLPEQTENPSCSEVKNFEPFVYLYTAGGVSSRKVVPLNHYRWLLTGETVRIYADLTPEEIGYTCIPFWLNSGFSGAFAAMLASESTLVLAPGFSATAFWDNICKYNTSYFLGTGQMFRYLWAVEPGEAEKKHGVKKVLSNGMPADLFTPFKERFNIPRIVEIYGTTENVGILVNIDEIPGMCGCLYLGGEKQAEVVRYNEETDDFARDEEGRLIRCSAGEAGILLLKVDEYENFEGYINNFEETEYRLLKNIWENGDLYFNTRDLVRLHANDYIEFVKRLDEIYRWRGKTVSAYRVRDVIRKFFGPVDDAYVVGVPVRGYEGRAGLAVVKLLAGEKLNWDKFTEYLKKRLSRAEMPVFIRLTTTGKRLKDNRNRYIEEGFDPSRTKEELFVYDQEKEAYVHLDEQIYQDILCHKFWI
ncbi:fatty-acyl-CoA synthase [Thermosyntropha lipolytica DSM 11003]|uniref:Fatty-acyl-CoA synthase n=1 Tax=Thermosyntropha lipolytica DSM 11003 TaxID=1123382 RepID=A0A1M5LW31_9FIRM|nr:AMP-binding protein [Thermosyntropha lipolytica]SHG69225.1 fatty-acyl-CoA synthase [Thermosyntropha lipolytica DSM 11003]